MLQRNSKANFGRVRRKARVVSSIPIVALLLLTSVLVGAVSPISTIGSLGSSDAYAAEENGGVATFSAWLSSSVTLTMADNAVKTIMPNTEGKFESKSIPLTIDVANSGYYDISLSGEPTMTGASDTIKAITLEAGEENGKLAASFKPNTWGYNLTKNTSTNTTGNIVKPTDTTTYLPVPEESTKAYDRQVLPKLMASDTYTLTNY